MTSISESVLNRRSTRSFTDQPVEKATLVELLQTASRSPSGSNLQPWFVYALTGNKLQEFLGRVRKSLAANQRGEGSEYELYPSNLGETYKARRFKCGEDMYATIGVERENKMARMMQFARNFDLFGAPVGLFFCIDRDFDRPQWAHLGMFIQTIMLLAHEKGLATCAQEAWSAMYKTTSSYLELPENQILYCGMALGYPDPDAPINSLVTDREPIENFASLRGF
ncbi:nitroreductase [uncultured Erythrobacter sp.]|uniref:nitroreductase n=1 Tax=uncultured Erythrobacter sp. TaxID=263913 RepID=UPI002637CC97|nr:nitroreductase [uncultured Erythrobacter sp.]